MFSALLNLPIEYISVIVLNCMFTYPCVSAGTSHYNTSKQSSADTQNMKWSSHAQLTSLLSCALVHVQWKSCLKHYHMLMRLRLHTEHNHTSIVQQLYSNYTGHWKANKSMQKQDVCKHTIEALMVVKDVDQSVLLLQYNWNNAGLFKNLMVLGKKLFLNPLVWDFSRSEKMALPRGWVPSSWGSTSRRCFLWWGGLWCTCIGGDRTNVGLMIFHWVLILNNIA